MVIRNRNRSSNTIFLSKFKISAKNLFKFRSIRAIKKLNFLTLNIKKVFNFLKQNLPKF